MNTKTTVALDFKTKLKKIFSKSYVAAFIFLPCFSLFAQSISQPSTSNITYESAVANFTFSPNCANGGNITVQWSTSSGLSNALSSAFSVGNGSVARSISMTNLLPNTTYYWRATGRAGLGCNQAVATTAVQTFVTASPPPASVPGVAITGITFDDANAMINYSIRANFGTTTSVIKYGTAPGALLNEHSGFSVTTAGNALTLANGMLSGLEQNTTYYFKIEATNSAGTGTTTTASFTTAVTVAPQLITEYSFDNSFSDVNGNAPFTTNSGVSLVNDRYGNSGRAINIVNTGSTATITGLPYGTSTRTIAFWVKVNNFNPSYNMLFTYGTSANNQAIGASYSASNVYHFGYSNNHMETLSHTANTWYHFAFTYDGTYSKIYRNGSLVGTSLKTWNTVNNTDLFKLGVGVGGELTFDGTIDDLKIYSTVLSLNQVNSLYNSYSIVTYTNPVDNPIISVYPNPAKNILHVYGQADVFDLIGNKVASGTNIIDIEHLLSGFYIVNTLGRMVKIVKE